VTRVGKMFLKLSNVLIEKLTRKGYRDAYVAENVQTGISYQIRALRDHRGWSQKKLAEVLNKPPSVICRLENPDYGKLSIQTLLEIASAFDVALLVQYVSFPEFLRRTRDVSQDALNAESFDSSQFLPFAAVTMDISADTYWTPGTTIFDDFGRGDSFDIAGIGNGGAAIQLTEIH
jgi:transcriptional regulator with XRE-family HTH domain